MVFECIVRKIFRWDSKIKLKLWENTRHRLRNVCKGYASVNSALEIHSISMLYAKGVVPESETEVKERAQHTDSNRCHSDCSVIEGVLTSAPQKTSSEPMVVSDE